MSQVREIDGEIFIVVWDGVGHAGPGGDELLPAREQRSSALAIPDHDGASMATGENRRDYQRRYRRGRHPASRATQFHPPRHARKTFA